MNEEFDAMYAANARMVYWTAYELTRNRNTAADITQATFLKACERWDTLERLLAPQRRNWLFTTCRNLGINCFHKNKRKDLLNLTEIDVPDDAPPVDELYEKQELVAWVVREVQALPGRYRDPLILHYYAQLSTGQAAKLLRVPAGTYRSRLSRARSILKRALENEVGEYEWN